MGVTSGRPIHGTAIAHKVSWLAELPEVKICVDITEKNFLMIKSACFPIVSHFCIILVLNQKEKRTSNANVSLGRCFKNFFIQI